MQVLFTVEFWIALPLLITLAALAFGFWMEGFEGMLIAGGFCVLAWIAMLYGRYERWLVLPVVLTIYSIVLTYRDRKDVKREGVRFMAVVLIIAWALVLYGRLTA